MKKVLVIRFSSIGDIVLTTPVILAVKDQLENCELHFLTKKAFYAVLKANPYIDKIHTIEESLSEIIETLKKENFDFIIDLHKNLRSKKVIAILKRPSATFNKLNIEKWMLVNFKINRLPEIHIVDRYFKAVESLNVKNDHKGLDYFIPEEDEIDISVLPAAHQKGYIGWVIGGKHSTKIFSSDRIILICQKLDQPIVLLGGKEDYEIGESIKNAVGDQIYNACGKFNLNQSASLVKQAKKIVTNDTGLMHIAAAFKKEIISLWGNTIPEFGMYPYLCGAENKSHILEVKNLKCRPCSKLGYKKCPKKHFDCMNKISEKEILNAIKN